MFGDKLKACRKKLGMTLQEVSLSMKHPRTMNALSAYEVGKRVPELDALLELAVGFGISLDEIFEEELEYTRKHISPFQKPEKPNRR